MKVCLPYISSLVDLKKFVSTPHNTSLIMGDRHKNFEDPITWTWDIRKTKFDLFEQDRHTITGGAGCQIMGRLSEYYYILLPPTEQLHPPPPPADTCTEKYQACTYLVARTSIGMSGNLHGLLTNNKHDKSSRSPGPSGTFRAPESTHFAWNINMAVYSSLCTLYTSSAPE